MTCGLSIAHKIGFIRPSSTGLTTNDGTELAIQVQLLFRYSISYSTHSYTAYVRGLVLSYTKRYLATLLKRQVLIVITVILIK